MSSFVIGKKEYVKVAGILAGIKAVKRDKFWVYDYAAGHPMDEKDFYNNMVECFEMNALSFYEQYKPRHEDLEIYTDSNDYMTTFKAYKQKGIDYAISNKLNAVIMEIRQFFQSAIYQTEKESYSWKMHLLFDRLLVNLMPFMYSRECESWGEFRIDNI